MTRIRRRYRQVAATRPSSRVARYTTLSACVRFRPKLASMKTRKTDPIAFPDDAELAALRAWYAELDTRAAVARYLGDRKAPGASARGVLGRIRRALIAYAASRHRADLADVFGERSGVSADTVARVIETLRSLPAPVPHIADDIDQWLPPRAVAALHAHGIWTLADLTVRIPRRRRWWTAIAGLGVAGARRVEAFFAAYPALTERARALIAAVPVGEIVPWEWLRVPHEVDVDRIKCVTVATVNVSLGVIQSRYSKSAGVVLLAHRAAHPRRDVREQPVNSIQQRGDALPRRSFRAEVFVFDQARDVTDRCSIGLRTRRTVGGKTACPRTSYLPYTFTWL